MSRPEDSCARAVWHWKQVACAPALLGIDCATPARAGWWQVAQPAAAAPRVCSAWSNLVRKLRSGGNPLRLPPFVPSWQIEQSGACALWNSGT